MINDEVKMKERRSKKKKKKQREGVCCCFNGRFILVDEKRRVPTWTVVGCIVVLLRTRDSSNKINNKPNKTTKDGVCLLVERLEVVGAREDKTKEGKDD